MFCETFIRPTFTVVRGSNVTQTTPIGSLSYVSVGPLDGSWYRPTSVKPVTRDHVGPPSALRHSPFPLRVPRYRTRVLFGSMASLSPMPRPGMLLPTLN